MFTNIFTLTLRQRALGFVIGMLSISAMLAVGVGAYSGIEDQLLEMMSKMPAFVMGMMGVNADFDASNIVVAEMLNLMAPLTLCGLAISMGTASIAGEERGNTLSVLLGNPKSRVEVLLAKMGALVVLLIGGGLLLGVSSLILLQLLGANLSSHLWATILHMGFLALFFGSFSAFVGAWTGNAAVATGSATGVLVVSWLAVGMLPMFPDLADVAKAFPWYYFSGASPLSVGVDVGHIAVLLSLSVVLLGGAVFGVRRRDLRFGTSGSLLDQLKKNPIAAKMLSKMGGGAWVTNITLRTVSEAQTIAIMVAFYTALMALAVGPLFNSLSDVLKKMADAFPKALLAMVGFADMSTAEGWYVAEVFSMVAPGVVIFVAAMVGTRALAGEEGARTMGVLLANPIPRWRVVVEKAAAICIVSAVVAFGVFLGTAGGNLVGTLGMSYGKIAAASTQSFAIGVFFGMVALAAGAATGKKSFANYVVAGVALLAWTLNAFLPVNPDLAKWAQVSPFHYYAENMPLLNGLSALNMGVLLGGAALLCLLAVVLFQRRDLRG
ncbi:MAG: ABC transporter permease subunit [Deltaproteobacteria bacterium]|nr:ABC transporter permease subunit [Deltaproteobacteria bacterium]